MAMRVGFTNPRPMMVQEQPQEAPQATIQPSQRMAYQPGTQPEFNTQLQQQQIAQQQASRQLGQASQQFGGGVDPYSTGMFGQPPQTQPGLTTNQSSNPAFSEWSAPSQAQQGLAQALMQAQQQQMQAQQRMAQPTDTGANYYYGIQPPTGGMGGLANPNNNNYGLDYGSTFQGQQQPSNGPAMPPPPPPGQAQNMNPFFGFRARNPFHPAAGGYRGGAGGFRTSSLRPFMGGNSSDGNPNIIDPLINLL